MNLLTATSEISDGSMSEMPGLAGEYAQTNKEKFCNKFGIDLDKVARGDQVHGANVAVVRELPSKKIPETDGLVTDLPGVYLSVFTADCLPLFLWNEKGIEFGIAHAGWKGMLAGVIPATAQTMMREYDLKVENIKARIGPCIRTCHHEVDEDHPDLVATAREQMTSLGISAENITDSGECTYCLKEKYFSLRRDRSTDLPKGLGNMLSVIGFLP
jgi:polyphenol oxidase